MRNYISELNKETREELQNEILFEVRSCDSRVDSICFYNEIRDDLIGEIYEILFHNKDDVYSVKLIPNFVLEDIYFSIEKQGVQFSESNIDLWLALFRDFCIEKIISGFSASD